MPSVDDDLQRRIQRAAPVPREGGPMFDAVVRRKRRRSVVRRASAVGVVALVLAGAIFAFAALDRPRTVTPGATTPAPLAEDLGLPFPTCRVSLMPINTDSGAGTAAVYTKMTDGECPAPGDGAVGVGVDMTGDGALDASWGPLPDCWLRCEAFAAPDVNGDGVSEIAVSTEGADGYGVSMYSVTTSPAAIAPIEVSSTFDRGPQDGEPFEFAWVDVATHASSAGCVSTTGQDPSFALYWTEKLTPAQVETISIAIQGNLATVTDFSTDTMPLDQAPMPGRDLCGAPIYGSAAGLASDTSTFIICDPTSTSGDLDGDGVQDRLSIGTKAASDLSCSDQGARILTIDLGGDGITDVRTPPPDCRTWCVPFALADLNGDGTDEILLNEGHLAPPVSAVIGVYELRDGALQPVLFPDGGNQFPVQGSWQGYLGAYCTNPSTFWLWQGNTDGGGSLRSTTGTAYHLNPNALRFEPTGVTFDAPNGIPAETGYNGTFCGAKPEPLG